MKRDKFYAIIIFTALLFSAALMPGAAQAGSKDFIWSVSMAMYPEFAEGFAANAVANHLLGRTQTDPALKGKHKMKIYDKGILYANQDEHLQAISRDALQMTYSGPHFLEALDKAWKLCEAPGVFRDWNHFVRTMNSPVWQELHKKMAEKHNVTILGWTCDIGSWFLFTRKGPVNSLDDIKSKKIRYAGGEAFAKALKSLGTTPIAIPYTEVVTALQTNMIDGLITDFTGGVDYYDLTRYTTNTVLVPITIQPMCIVASTKWWEGLDKEARQAIKTVFDVMTVQPFYEKLQGSQIQKWKDDPKLTVVDPSEGMVDEWQKLMRGSIVDMIAGIEPQFMQAVDSCK